MQHTLLPHESKLAGAPESPAPNKKQRLAPSTPPSLAQPAQSTPTKAPAASEYKDSSFLSPTPTRAASSFISPVQPNIATPPEGFEKGQSFFFLRHKCQGKTLGFTPGRKNTVLLEKYEGEAHRISRATVNGNTLTVRENTILDASSKSIYAARLLIIITQLKNLKKRVDEDQRIAKTRGRIDPAHLHAAKIKIQKCIDSLQACYQLKNCKVTDLLNSLNKTIADGKYYNPFELKSLYNGNNQAQLNKSICEIDLRKFAPTLHLTPPTPSPLPLATLSLLNMSAVVQRSQHHSVLVPSGSSPSIPQVDNTASGSSNPAPLHPSTLKNIR